MHGVLEFAMARRRWGLGFGVGTIFSLIIVFFIYKYSQGQHAATDDLGWAVLEFVTKWYLLIFLGIAALVVVLAILGLIWTGIVYFTVKRQMRKMYREEEKKSKKKENIKVIDADYRVKEEK
jgi:hypothetical protein